MRAASVERGPASIVMATQIPNTGGPANAPVGQPYRLVVRAHCVVVVAVVEVVWKKRAAAAGAPMEANKAAIKEKAVRCKCTADFAVAGWIFFPSRPFPPLPSRGTRRS